MRPQISSKCNNPNDGDGHHKTLKGTSVSFHHEWTEVCREINAIIFPETARHIGARSDFSPEIE